MKFIRIVTLLLFLWAPSGTLAHYPSPGALERKVQNLSTAEMTGLEKRARAGYADAQLRLGLVPYFALIQADAKALYDAQARTEDRSEKIKTAREWLGKSARQGNVPAQYFLAKTYKVGYGPTLDHVEMIAWLTKAAQNGYVPAMVDLGQFYRDPCCKVPSDSELAERWFRKAAGAADPSGMFLLAELLEEKDPTQATAFYLKAAKRGHSAAQNALAIRYAEGVGAKRNSEEAIGWFLKSAKQGNPFGACNLALHYAQGDGIATDALSALKWALISHSLDSLKCHPDEFTEHLKVSDVQAKKAWDLAVQWLRRHPKLTNDFGERPWMETDREPNRALPADR